jgi:hypothetical protein
MRPLYHESSWHCICALFAVFVRVELIAHITTTILDVIHLFFSDAGVSLRLQMEHTQISPTERASLCLRRQATTPVRCAGVRKQRLAPFIGSNCVGPT